MSLFGDDDLPSRPKQSALFDDDPKPTGRAGSSLFADNFNDGADSPWAFPTPKKAARGTLVKTLLPATDVPESYIDAYDALLASGDRMGAGISLTGVKKLLGESGLHADTQAKILDIVVHPGQDSTAGFARSEFNVLLALIGLAQEGEDVTLDSVDDRKRNLPETSLPMSKPANSPKPVNAMPAPAPPTPPSAQSQPSVTPNRSRPMRKESFGFPETDPWGSPALHRGHNHQIEDATTTQNTATTFSNGTITTRTTSTFTTTSENIDSTPTNNHIGDRPTVGSAGGWGAYNGSSADRFTGSGLGGEGFGPPSGGDEGSSNNPGGLGRSLGGGRVASNGIEEVVTVTAISEKEGMFMFQHRNYEVTSARRSSKVIRRYSDFVWLLDCLHKRYPFRQLPLLPPKRVASKSSSTSLRSMN